MNTRVKSFVRCAAAATVLGMLGSANAMPYVWIKMQAQVPGTDGTHDADWVSTLNLSSAPTSDINYRVWIEMIQPDGTIFNGQTFAQAAPGYVSGNPSNSAVATAARVLTSLSWTVGTGTSTTGETDGIGSGQFKIFQDTAADATQINFKTGVLQAAGNPGTTSDDWSAGSSITSLLTRGTTTNDIKVQTGKLGGKTAAIAPEIMMTGAFSIDTLGAAGSTTGLRFQVLANWNNAIDNNKGATAFTTTDPVAWQNGAALNLPGGKDPVIGFLPFSIVVAGGNNSILTVISTASIGKVIAGSTIPTSLSTGNITVSNSGSNDGNFSITPDSGLTATDTNGTAISAGAATGNGTGVFKAHLTTPGTASSTAGTQNLGNIVIANTSNGSDATSLANRTVAVQAQVISQAGAVTLALGTVTVPFGGHLLQNATVSGSVQVTNSSAYVGNVVGSSVTGAATGSTIDAATIINVPAINGGVPGSALVPFTIHAGSVAQTYHTTVTVKNGAADFYNSGQGSDQGTTNLSSFFDIFTELTTTVPAAGAAGHDRTDPALFGAAQGSQVAANGSYAGLASTSGGVKGTTAKLLGGNAPASPSSSNVTMAWRNAMTDETTGGTPGTGIFGTGFKSPNVKILSDVVDINGIPLGTAYVLQMTFDPGDTSVTPDPLGALNSGQFQIATWDGNQWVPAEQHHGSADHLTGNIDPKDTWMGLIVGTAPWNGTDMTVGDYGAYRTGDGSLANPYQYIAWEVVDHNSQFAVTPEPATVGLLALSALCLTIRRRRHTA